MQEKSAQIIEESEIVMGSSQVQYSRFGYQKGWVFPQILGDFWQHKLMNIDGFWNQYSRVTPSLGFGFSGTQLITKEGKFDLLHQKMAHYCIP